MYNGNNGRETSERPKTLWDYLFVNTDKTHAFILKGLVSFEHSFAEIYAKQVGKWKKLFSAS